MAGYIGTKAALLSTTTASVGGDSTVGGDLTVDTDTLHVDSANNRVGVGTASPANGKLVVENNGSNLYLKQTTGDYGHVIGQNDADGALTFSRRDGSNTERFRVDASGNLLVGTTSTDPQSSSSNSGVQIGSGFIFAGRSGEVAILNRQGSDGDIAVFRKDGTTVGSIGTSSNNVHVVNPTSGLVFASNVVAPCDPDGSSRDNLVDLGNASRRFDDIYATNGTIQTSDRNEKQDIAALTTTEMLVAARISAMFKTFRWIDKVASNPNARTHTGIIAQDVQQAFTDEGLDAGDYALFISDTWTDDDGNSQTRMGIRYPELLSFIAAYNEQRFTDIEARLTALEAV